MARISILVPRALLLLLLCLSGPAGASFHTWRITELYSNASGTVQFIELREGAGDNGEHLFLGHTLTSSSGGTNKVFVFPSNLPSSSTANRSLLLGTQGFANLGVVTPNFVIPDGFLFVAGGTLDFSGVDQVTYGPLPTDGELSVGRTGTTGPNSPTNFAGVTGHVSSPAPTISPQTGWWWNPAQSGRGFFIEKRGANVFLAGYLYEADGRSTWVMSAGPIAGTGAYTGDLLRFTGGQELAGVYRPPAAPTSLGTITLQFADATHGTLSWPGETIAIERFDFAGIGAPHVNGDPETGWWWNTDESGRGFALEIQGTTMFVAGYMYDAAGNPTWYMAVGPIAVTTESEQSGYGPIPVRVVTLTGNWIQFANGQTLGGAYRAPTQVSPPAGPLTLRFKEETNGTLTLPDGRQIALTRFAF